MKKILLVLTTIIAIVLTGCENSPKNNPGPPENGADPSTPTIGIGDTLQGSEGNPIMR